MKDRLVQEVRRLRTTVKLMGAAMVTTAGLSLLAAAAPRQDLVENLRVRSLSVVDANGVERVVIAAPVPDPMVRGQRMKRAGGGAGIILNGPDGNERGGYMVTDKGGEALLTLDGGRGGEVFKVVGNSEGSASLFLQNYSGAVVALTTYRGEPELQLLGSRGERVHAIPANAPMLK
jgi:hypothetical protein